MGSRREPPHFVHCTILSRQRRPLLSTTTELVVFNQLCVVDCDFSLVTPSPTATGTVPHSASPGKRVLRLLRAVGEQPVRVQEQARAQDLRHYYPAKVGHSNRNPQCGCAHTYIRRASLLSVASLFERPRSCGKAHLAVTPESCVPVVLNLAAVVPGISLPHG